MGYTLAVKRKTKDGDSVFKKPALPMIFLLLYVFFLYVAQETLLPPRLHSIIMYAFVAITLVSLLLKGGGRVPLPSYSLWYSALLLFSFFSFIWATNRTTDTVYTMIVSLVITYCFLIVLNTKERLEACAKCFVLAADAMGLLLIVTGQFIASEEGDRLGQTVTGNANIFSALMMIAAVFAIWLVIYKAKGLPKLGYLASYAFVLVMMALSGGRKTMVAVVVCTMFFIVFKNGTVPVKLIRNILIAVAVVIALYYLIMNVPVLYEAIGVRFEELFKMLAGETSGVDSDESRKELIVRALERWQERPLFGYGLDTFKYYNKSVGGKFYYAHNNYAEILYDLGIVGFLLYYGYVLKLTVSLLRAKGDHREYKMLGLGLIATLLFFDFGGVSYFTVMMQIVLCLAFLCKKHCEKPAP